MTRVLALDPGSRVGWARANVAEDGSWTNLRHGITPLQDMAIAVHHALGLDMGGEGFRSYDVIVCEDWRLYPTKAKEMIGSTFPSVQFIGAVRLCCWLSGTKLVMQGASVMATAEKFMPTLMPDINELATRPIAHDDGHDQSALKHLAFWTFKNTTLGQRPREAAA